MYKIAILRGGPSDLYDLSLKTGKTALDALASNYRVKDIVIDKRGHWYVNGLEVKPMQALFDVDLVFNAMHGEYGEDGIIQQLLESIGVPYTGSRILGSRMALDKVKAKEFFKEIGIKTPLHKVLNKTDNIRNLAFETYRSFPIPAVLKPITKGSSADIYIVKTERELEEILPILFEKYDQILLEEFISGQEVSVGVIDNFRDQEFYGMLPIQIDAHSDGLDKLFDNEMKITGKLFEQTCPAKIDRNFLKQSQEFAKMAHRELGLRDYSRSDFRIHPRRGVYMLEINSLPTLYEEAPFFLALESVGSGKQEFFDHLISLALHRK